MIVGGIIAHIDTDAIEWIGMDQWGNFEIQLRHRLAQEATAIVRVEKSYELNFTEHGTLAISHGAG